MFVICDGIMHGEDFVIHIKTKPGSVQFQDPVAVRNSIMFLKQGLIIILDRQQQKISYPVCSTVLAPSQESAAGSVKNRANGKGMNIIRVPQTPRISPWLDIPPSLPAEA